MKKKSFLLILSLVLAVSAAAFGTIAYLTDRESITNTFSVGQINITLNETEINTSTNTPVYSPTDLDPNGNPIEGAVPQRTTQGNQYHLLPGQTYIKDPTVTLEKGGERSYVRMLVTLKGASALKALYPEGFLPQNFVNGWDSSVWPCHQMIDYTTATPAQDVILCEFRYVHTDGEPTVQPAADEDLVLDALFDSITVPGDLTGADLQTLYEAGFEIKVYAQAIQSTMLETADIAWAAFEDQNGAIVLE